MKDPEFRDDRLDDLLGEWSAPEPPAQLDTRITAAFHARRKPSLWRRAWSLRITIPAPVFAALVVLIGIAVWWQRRSTTAPTPAPHNDAGYFTRVEAAGYQPLPDGAVRVIRARDRSPQPERQGARQ